MAELSGKVVVCPGCQEETPVYIDKRQKLFLNCGCGLQKYNTEKGQKILAGMMVAAEGEKAAAAAEIPEKTPEVSGPEIQKNPEKKRGGSGGLMVLGLGLLSMIGVAVWKSSGSKSWGRPSM